MKLNDIVTALAALAQQTRLQAFRELVKAHSPDSDTGLAAGELAQRLGIPPPTLSFHLKELSSAGLITSRKQGRSIIYRANLDAMAAVANYLLQDCCGGSCDPNLQPGEKSP